MHNGSLSDFDPKPYTLNLKPLKPKPKIGMPGAEDGGGGMRTGSECLNRQSNINRVQGSVFVQLVS